MKAGIETQLLEIPSVFGLEPTYLTESSGKWLVLLKKIQKDQARRSIDTVINETLFSHIHKQRNPADQTD